MLKALKIRKFLKTRKTHFSYASPYDILGVPEDENLQKIKKKYFNLVTKYHPDKNPTKVT